MAVSPDGKYIAVAVAGTHEIALIDRNKLNERLAAEKNEQKTTPSSRGWNNVVNNAGFLYGIRDFIPTEGKGARGILFTDNNLVCSNYSTGDIFIYNPATRKGVASTIGSSLLNTQQGKGEYDFLKSTMVFRSWLSCATVIPKEPPVPGLTGGSVN